MTKLLIVDPHPFFCASLAAAFDADPRFEVAGWVATEHDAEERAADADVVVTELSLQEGSGFSLARRLKGRVPVVLLARAPDEHVVVDALRAGTSGCLSHDCTVEVLADALLDAVRGRFAVDRDRLRDVLESLAAPPDPTRSRRLQRLTRREREVLDLVAEGLDNDDIATRLYLTANTVRTHVGNILRKLGVHSRAEAVRELFAADAPEDIDMLHISGPELAP